MMVLHSIFTIKTLRCLVVCLDLFSPIMGINTYGSGLRPDNVVSNDIVKKGYISMSPGFRPYSRISWLILCSLPTDVCRQVFLMSCLDNSSCFFDESDREEAWSIDLCDWLIE